MRVAKSLEDRFLEKVSKSDTGCWIWTGQKNRNGYGIISIGHAGKMLAHRLSFQIKNGNAPSDCVLHRCDTPACVNPDHLFSGTRTDNFNDMVNKGRKRNPMGEKNAKAKLTAEIVKEIRLKYKPGNGPILAKEYGIHHTSLYDLISGKTWRHV